MYFKKLWSDWLYLPLALCNMYVYCVLQKQNIQSVCQVLNSLIADLAMAATSLDHFFMGCFGGT